MSKNIQVMAGEVRSVFRIATCNRCSSILQLKGVLVEERGDWFSIEFRMRCPRCFRSRPFAVLVDMKFASSRLNYLLRPPF